jgi:thiosulfate/3-mercaptopyruvate sulfurtransferase
MTIRTLVSVDTLREAIARGDVLVVDCRFDLADASKGERDHRAAHVTGAVYAHLDHDLSDTTKQGLGRHPLPDDDAFSAVLTRWGWRPEIAVVAYDDAGGALAAARLWWLLRLAGHARVAVLDGGWAAWMAAGAPVSSGAEPRTACDVHVALDGAAVIGYAELERRRAGGDLLLVDARAAPRFRGEAEPIDPVAGHVPGAVNRPFSDNLEASGTFKSTALLRKEWDALLRGRAPAEVAHMCGSGVTACHNLLAMEHAGLTGSRVFAPSWSGWVGDRSRAVATGA